MAAAGYGVELTVESIWATGWDTTQFGYINVIIGTEFNFYITGDGDTDIVDTKVTGMLKETTHKLFGYWNAMVKSSAVVNPWNWVHVWLNEIDFAERYKNLITKAKNILGESKIEMVTRRLPQTTDSQVIP